MVQNKLHWAITGQTAAELIYSQADVTKLYMGLATWKHAPEGKILKSDVTVAKNYLSEAHVKELNRIVSAYLDLAENRAERGIATKMSEWVTFLHSFLELSSYPIRALARGPKFHWLSTFPTDGSSRSGISTHRRNTRASGVATRIPAPAPTARRS